VGLAKLAKDHGIEHGDIFVGNNLMIISSRLLDKRGITGDMGEEREITRWDEREDYLDAGSLLDLCSLINALVFHDRIITLISKWESQQEASTLYQYLMSRGLIKRIEFNKIEDINDAEMLDIEDILRKQISYKQVQSAVSLLFHYPDYEGGGGSQPQKSLRYRRALIESVLKGENNVFDFLGTDEWRHEQEFNYRIRTAIYWVFSDTCNIPFQPEFIRIPIIHEYNARIRQSLRMFITANIDKLARKELDNALSIAEVKTIPIPNLFLRFLNLYSQHDLDYSLDSLRNEFAEHKKKLAEWETALRLSRTSYGETLKIIKELYSSLDSINPRDKSELAISLAPAIFADIVIGSPGIGTATTALAEGLKIIRRWSNSSRLSYFTKGKNEAQAIRNEPELFEKVFGRSLSFRETETFLSLTDALDSLHDSPRNR
jgi:hypothetical protein